MRPTRPVASWLVVLLAAAPGGALAGVWDELASGQRRSVESGDAVMVEVPVAGVAWPKVTIYERIDSSPEEAAAVFADYGRHQVYIPNVLKSSITGQDGATAEIDYVLDIRPHVFFLPSQSAYSVKDTVSSYDGGASFRVDWRMTRHDGTVEDTVGSARFERFGTGTIMAYENFVIPASRLAGLVKGRAMQQVKDVAQAVAAQVAKERAGESALLQTQRDALRRALGTPPVPQVP